MDETKNPEDPQVEPLNWSQLDPKLTKAIVAAQRLATTVDNDGRHPTQGWMYPTQAAIACKAREAMGESGIAIIMIGWTKSNGAVFGEFIIVHQDGPCSPTFGAGMAIPRNSDETKGIAAAISILRKYVIAGILNMGWRDPSEDSDGNPSPGPRQKQNQNQNRQQQQRHPQTQQQAPPNPVDVHRAQLIVEAKSWWKWMISKGIANTAVVHFVSGLDGGMPRPSPTSLLEAIVVAGKALSAGFGDALPATSHSELVTFMRRVDVPVLWCDGNSTPDGDSVDKKWPAGR